MTRVGIRRRAARRGRSRQPVLALPIGAEVGAIDIMSNCSYNSGMPARRGNSFEDFYGELEADARAEGPEAIRDLRAKEIKYALINTLITRRRDLNLTQQTLAEHAGVAQTEISKIERGRKSPTLDTFSRIAGALRLTFSAPGNAPRTVLGARRINADRDRIGSQFGDRDRRRCRGGFG